jgi:hypothetical protein
VKKDYHILNIKGLGNHSKRLTLAHLVEIHKQILILIQATMGGDVKVLKGLGNLFKDWE